MIRRGKTMLALAGLGAFITLGASAVAPAANSPVPCTVTLSGRTFAATPLTSPAAKRQGLVGRPRLRPNEAALFVFPDALVRAFWMHAMSYPIDIAFFDAEAVFINAVMRAPPCRTPSCPRYLSAASTRYVLELPAGSVRALALRRGHSRLYPHGECAMPEIERAER